MMIVQCDAMVKILSENCHLIEQVDVSKGCALLQTIDCCISDSDAKEVSNICLKNFGYNAPTTERPAPSPLNSPGHLRSESVSQMRARPSQLLILSVYWVVFTHRQG